MKMQDTPQEAAIGDKAARELMAHEKALQVKHTPAPWTVIDNGIWDISIKAGGTVCHINSKGDWFSSGKDTLVGRSQNKMLADARLIAAAPELLEACKKALYALKGREHDQFLRAAIAKAEGKA